MGDFSSGDRRAQARQVPSRAQRSEEQHHGALQPSRLPLGGVGNPGCARDAPAIPHPFSPQKLGCGAAGGVLPHLLPFTDPPESLLPAPEGFLKRL